MEGTIDRRGFGAAALRLGALSVTTAALALGCAGSEAPQAAAAPRPAVASAAPTKVSARQPPQSGEEAELRAAQRVWCEYLQALYLRADHDATSWPQLEECTAATSAASARMLKATAECSRRALDQTDGDPFTPAYAAQVSRCGSDAIDAAAIPPDEVTAYVTLLCSRIATCGEVDVDECHARLTEGLGPHLCRALGAMNGQSREQVRACFGGITCEGIGDQINGCVEPIMDALLWLPH